MAIKCFGRKRLYVPLATVSILGFFSASAWAALPIGWLDGIDYNGTASGWAQDPQGLASPAVVQVQFYMDGESLPCATTTANIPRDVGAYGFRITLPERVRAGGQHQLHVWAVDANNSLQKVELSGSPQSYNVSSADNVDEHVFSGSLYQIGPSIGNIWGGRPLNKYSANEAKTLISANWQASATLPWQSRGNSPISVTAVPRMAGAISSIMWDNVEFIDSGGHGAAFQYVLHGNDGNGNYEGELYNPTEAGSKADDAVSWWGTSLVLLQAHGGNPTHNFYFNGSASELNYLTGGGAQPLHTLQRMAYWIPRVPNPSTWPYTYSNCIDANGAGLIACDAFYTPSQAPNLATHLDLAAPAAGNDMPSYYDNNNSLGLPNEVNNPNILSPYYLEKTVTAGAFSLNNVIKVEGKFTIPAGIASSKVDDFQLVAYLDRKRFQRVFFYNLTTGAFAEQSALFEPSPSAVICTSGAASDPNQERYAIGMYSPQMSTEIYAVDLQPGNAGNLLMGSGVGNMGWSGPYQMDTYVVIGALADVKTSLAGLYANLGGLKAEYFRDTTTLSGTPYWIRKDATVNFSTNKRPSSAVGNDNFSIRWTGKIIAASSGTYTLHTYSDDGVRLYVDGQLVINNWTDHAPTLNSSAPMNFTYKSAHTVTMEYYDHNGGATAQLLWSYPGQAQQVIPSEYLRPPP